MSHPISRSMSAFIGLCAFYSSQRTRQQRGPCNHVLASDWIRNGKRLIRETRQSIVRTNLSYVHCAFIQFSDPVNLTDTSEMKIRKGFPSALPWWSVEIRRGPAFL